MKINWFYVIVAVLFCAAIYFLDVGLHFLVKKLFCMVNIGNIPLAGLVQPNYSSGVNHASIIGAALGAGGSIVNGLIGAFSQNKANKLNAKLQREANALNYQMFQEGNEFNRQMAFDMFNAENAYNDPSAQAERLRNAGMNPALVAENATATTGNASGSAPTSVSPSNMLAPQMQPLPSPFTNIFTHLQQLASAFATYNQGKNTEKQTSWLDRINDKTIAHLNAQILGEEAMAKFNSVMATVNQEWLPKRYSAEIEKMFAEACAAYARGDNDTANALYTDLLSKFKEKELDVLNQKAPFLVSEIEETVKLIKSKQGTERASQKALDSQANLNKKLGEESESRTDLNKQQKQFVDETWSWSKSILESKSQEAIYNLIENKETIIYRIMQAKMLPGLTEKQIQMLDQEIERLRKANSWINVKSAVEVLQGVCGAYQSVTQGSENATGALKNVVQSAVPFYIGR